ncbi:MAG: hypothetical protein GF308_01750 [Candidatus Heimdallarchaeota archaeon]|nr:hypothetical protein [Candidatus Heimdallarchaeota archaeon]
MTKKIQLEISGMSCNGCAASIGRALNQLEGIKEAEASYPKGSVTITFNEKTVSKEKIIETIEGLGYGVKRRNNLLRR